MTHDIGTFRGIQRTPANVSVWMNYTVFIKVARLSALAHGVTSLVVDKAETYRVTAREREREK